MSKEEIVYKVQTAAKDARAQEHFILYDSIPDIRKRTIYAGRKQNNQQESFRNAHSRPSPQCYLIHQVDYIVWEFLHGSLFAVGAPGKSTADVFIQGRDLNACQSPVILDSLVNTLPLVQLFMK